MTRKIISIKSMYGYNFPSYESKILEEELEYQGMVFPVGHIDPQWEHESTHIELMGVDGRTYYSVVKETTLKMLKSPIDLNKRTLDDYDIKFENDFSIELIKELTRKNSDYMNIEKLDYIGALNAIEDIDLLKSELHINSEDNVVGIAST